MPHASDQLSSLDGSHFHNVLNCQPQDTSVRDLCSAQGLASYHLQMQGVYYSRGSGILVHALLPRPHITDPLQWLILLLAIV